MENVTALFSILFFIVFFFSITMGGYTLYVNPNGIINRVFFAICISLALWSLGFSFAVSASSLEMCLLWRRISCFGWGTFLVY